MTHKNPITGVWISAYGNFLTLTVWRGEVHKSYACYDFIKDYNPIERSHRMENLVTLKLQQTKNEIARSVVARNA